MGPIAVGVLLGLITLVGIGYAARSERGVEYWPILLTVSFVLAIMHIVIVWYGTSMPLFRMSFELSQ